MSKASENKKYIVLIFFIFSCLFHFILADFEKMYRVIPDEFRYYEIAYSIFHGNGVALRTMATDYQKVLYSLILAPTFAIKNGISRMKMIGLINSVLMSLSIFPIYGICNRLRIRKSNLILILLIFTFWPDLLYSSTFMAEVIFWPTSWLFFYIWVIFLDKSQWHKGILLGVAGYLAYMAKEISLAYILALVGFEIIYPMFLYFSERRKVKAGEIPIANSRRFKECISKEHVCFTATAVITFCFIHFILKMTIFKGLGNSYDQMGIAELLLPGHFSYLIYGFFYYIAASAVAALIIPLIMPALNYYRYDETEKRLLLFNYLNFFIALATISYTIIIREEYCRIAPRVHLRYVGPILVIFVILFLAETIKDGGKEPAAGLKLKTKAGKIACIGIGGFSLFTCLMFKGVGEGPVVDQQTLQWVVKLQEIFNVNASGFELQKQEMTYGHLYVIVPTLLCFAAVIVFLEMKNRGALARKVFAITLLIICLLNLQIGNENIHNFYSVDQTLVSEIENIQSEIDPESSVLYIADNDNLYCLYALDSYYTNNENLRLTTYDYYSFIRSCGYATISIADLQIPFIIESVSAVNSPVDSIDYIIMNRNDADDYLNGVEEVDQLSNDYYIVYRNLDNTTINFGTEQ